MPYCEKCGNKMSDDAVFCSKCGQKVEPVETKIEGTDNQIEVDYQTVSEKRLNNKVLISVAVVVTAFIIGLLLSFIFKGDKVVIEYEDGEDVFAFTLSEFVDRYNENSYNKLRVDDFEKSEEKYTLYEDDFYLYIDVDKGNYPCYVTSVYIVYYTDENSAPEEVVNVVRAIYGMSEKEAHEKVEDAIVHGGAGEFDDTMLFLDIDSYKQKWHFIPSK